MPKKLRRRTTQMNTTNSDAAVAKKREELTLAGCLDRILTYATQGNSVEVDENGNEVNLRPQAEYDYVRDILDINPAQAELFAAIMELSINGDATAENVARRLGCSNLHFLELQKDVEILVNKRYVRSSSYGYRGIVYRVPNEVIKQIRANVTPDDADISGLSTSGIVRKMNSLFAEFWNDSIEFEVLKAELLDLLRHNPEDIFVKEYRSHGVDKMSSAEKILFLYMVTRHCVFGEESFGWENFGKLFIGQEEEDVIREGLDLGDFDLMENGVIEYVNDNGIVDNSRVCFVESERDKFLANMPLTHKPQTSCNNLIRKESLAEKKLFYNENEKKQIANLTDLLMPENFRNIESRLKEKGMRSGFCCLFHGKPGTGKTESVYQIARQTGRDIFLVDISEIKGKWVGESEKNIRGVFQEYKRLVKNRDVAPILLFNEADAIFGVRKKVAEESVDKMNNAVQNIILQEMETLSGILIATTNLTSNLDEAFERRFLIKVDFQKPDIEARTHIWESLIEGIDSTTAETLAKDFSEFSGGQIENISRKATVGYILSGVQPDLNGLRELCENESFTVKKPRVRIGF